MTDLTITSGFSDMIQDTSDAAENAQTPGASPAPLGHYQTTHRK